MNISRQLKIVFVFFVFFLLVSRSSIADDIELYTYRLTQSNNSYQLWTAPPSHRVFKDEIVPDETGSAVRVYAAKNEFEPFQVAVRPTSSGNVVIDIGEFGLESPLKSIKSNMSQSIKRPITLAEQAPIQIHFGLLPEVLTFC